MGSREQMFALLLASFLALWGQFSILTTGWWELVVLEACRSLPHSQECFTSLHRKEPKAVGGKQAKHSFVLRE